MEETTYFVILVMLATWLGTGMAQDPEITENILPEIKNVGLTGRLHCVIINQMDNPVYWVHKDKQMIISSDDKIVLDEAHNVIENGWPKYEVERVVSGDRISYTLIINRMERRDAGHYTCQILVRGQAQHPSKDGEMVVLVPPSISQSQTTHTETVKEGNQLNLTCNGDGYPTPNITWVRVNGNVLPNGKLRHQGKSLFIEHVTTADRGIYRCLADNAVRPPAVYDATVLVNFRPTSKAVQSSYGQASNRMFDITMECTVAGWPEPDLQWYKQVSADNKIPIQNSDKYTVNILLNHANILDPQERWFQLVIRSVTANDYGVYLCEGRNNMGSREAKIKLFETSECQGPNCPEEQDTAKEASLATRTASLWASAVMAAIIALLTVS